MTDKEKMVKLISDTIWRYEPLLKYEPTPTPPGIPSVPEAIADALIAAGFRDVDERRTIFMNGEAIVPTPDIYNKVAELLGCPLMSGVLPDEVKVFDDGTFGNEDKHRAEVAELALKNACYSIARSITWERYKGTDPSRVESLQRYYLIGAESQLRKEAKK